jgi:hypothetical protein
VKNRRKKKGRKGLKMEGNVIIEERESNIHKREQRESGENVFQVFH